MEILAQKVVTGLGLTLFVYHLISSTIKTIVCSLPLRSWPALNAPWTKMTPSGPSREYRFAPNSDKTRLGDQFRNIRRRVRKLTVDAETWTSPSLPKHLSSVYRWCCVQPRCTRIRLRIRSSNPNRLAHRDGSMSES